MQICEITLQAIIVLIVNAHNTHLPNFSPELFGRFIFSLYFCSANPVSCSGKRSKTERPIRMGENGDAN